MALTLHDVKSHLWSCAEILRGSAVDRTDWKAHILPLLFFKRICDVWDEETAEAADLFGDVDPVDFPEVHRFRVPDGCHWRDVRETPANLGAALSHAMREIERANPDTLYRVFGGADGSVRLEGHPELGTLAPSRASPFRDLTDRWPTLRGQGMGSRGPVQDSPRFRTGYGVALFWMALPSQSMAWPR